MTTCHGHSPGCAILPPMMRRLIAEDVTLLMPQVSGSDLSTVGGAGEGGEGVAAEGWDNMRINGVVQEYSQMHDVNLISPAIDNYKTIVKKNTQTFFVMK